MIIGGVWESQAKLEEKGELQEDEWKLYHQARQAARWPRWNAILGRWREKVVPRKERLIKWVFERSIWVVTFCLCCVLYLC